MRINRTFLHYCRVVHTYLTMFGLLVMLMFSMTGFAINHEDWFGATTPRASETDGKTPAALIAASDGLRIVEHLRSTFHINGAMHGYEDLDDKLAISFRSPGQAWEVEIEKASGATKVHTETTNLIALFNNLHRGRYTGTAWHLVIDMAAMLILIACLTGFILWVVLPKRRMWGVIGLIAGFAIPAMIYFLIVPGADTARLPTKDSDENVNVEK